MCPTARAGGGGKLLSAGLALASRGEEEGPGRAAASPHRGCRAGPSGGCELLCVWIKLVKQSAADRNSMQAEKSSWSLASVFKCFLLHSWKLNEFASMGENSPLGTCVNSLRDNSLDKGPELLLVHQESSTGDLYLTSWLFIIIIIITLPVAVIIALIHYPYNI